MRSGALLAYAPTALFAVHIHDGGCFQTRRVLFLPVQLINTCVWGCVSAGVCPGYRIAVIFGEEQLPLAKAICGLILKRTPARDLLKSPVVSVLDDVSQANAFTACF